MDRLIDVSRVIEEPSNVIFLLVDTHEGVVKATFLRTRISLMGCLPKEFGVELTYSEDFIATLSNFLGGVFMTQTNKSTQCESIPSSIQNSIQGEEENKEEEKETSEEKSEEPFIEQYDEVSSKNEFDRSRGNFDYHYYVIGGCNSVEARRQLTQEFPQNVHFKEVKCIVYTGLTPLEEKLLVWDHNHDNEYRAEMKFIQKIQFFHNEFIDLCEGDKSKATFEFRLQCCMEVGIVIHEKDTKRKSDMLRAVDSQFQLAWHIRYVWDIIDNIFSMWDEFKVKGKKMKKMKKDLYSCSSSKSIPTLLPLPDDMSPSPWRCLQGIKDEKILISILSRVKSTDISLNEMAEEFTNLSYAIYNGDCEKLDTLVPRKEYSLMIVDIPHGYNIKGCINDEEPFSYKQFKRVVEEFCKVTTSNMWRFIVFHSDAQQGMVLTKFRDLTNSRDHLIWHKPNIRSKIGHKFSTCHYHIYVGYWTKDGEQCPQMINFKDGVDYNSILSYNAVVKKLKHMDKDSHGEIVNPYQKPQSLINYLIDMFSNEGDWVLDLFSGSGTTIACSLKKGRNCISVEKDLIQVNYINQRVNALSQLPDEFQEVCFKEGNIDSNKVVMCSMEPQPPLGNLIGKEHYGELANIEDPLSRSIVVIPDSIEEVVGSMHEIDPTPFDDEQGLLDYIDK
eukprot:Gb_37443 [translate_table: standard]